jgi:phage shock protein PspC (stress-responsive transcriptional regulator)
MNKTVSCNISGLIFNLEEIAFERLDKYLNKLKNHLNGAEGRDEIYADIELRIAELCSNKLSRSSQVITLVDVEEIIQVLGEPEEYVEVDENLQTESPNETRSTTSDKKVFMRDEDNAIIAGVCSGVSAFFGIDLTLVRVLFVIFLLFPGFSALVYIILWIIAPSAKTAADKLRLRGEPVNIDSIKKEVEEAANRIEKFSKKKFSVKNRSSRSKPSRFGQNLRAIIGFLLLITALLSIMYFFIFSFSDIGVLSTNNGEQFISIYEFSETLFSSGFQSILGKTSIMGVVLIPFILIAFLGAKLLFNLRGGWVKYPASILFVFWILSIGAASVVGLQLGREFSHYAETTDQIGDFQSNKLSIRVPDHVSKEYQSDNYVRLPKQPFLEVQKDDIKGGIVRVKVIASNDSLFHIYRERTSNGISYNRAIRAAKNISHQILLKDHELIISPSYLFPIEDRLRGQGVTVFIEVPENGKVNWHNNKDYFKILELLDQ